MKPPHASQTCEEAKAENDKENARAKVADAMTAAVVRNCPCCKKPFVKEEGCNKMKCPNCKTLSCYLCRQKISGYEHFCRTPHCDHSSCNKCILFTKSVHQDDNRARREAALKEQEKLGAVAEDLGLLTPPPKEKKKGNFLSFLFP
jgi:TRIAD3 protein (E3 ubiquitin-protein ligase RNF216)